MDEKPMHVMSKHMWEIPSLCGYPMHFWGTVEEAHIFFSYFDDEDMRQEYLRSLDKHTEWVSEMLRRHDYEVIYSECPENTFALSDEIARMKKLFDSPTVPG